MTPEQFQQLLTVLSEISSSLRTIAITKSDTHQTGFDSKLAPKVISIERGGEDGNSCLSCDKKPLSYRSLTGILERLSFESGKSANYGEYTLVFAWFNTDNGLVSLKCGNILKPSVSLRNLLFGLSQLSSGSQLITLEFLPNLGTSEIEKKIVNIKLFDKVGNEIATAFPKEKETDRDSKEIQAYWENLLIEVAAKINNQSATPKPTQPKIEIAPTPTVELYPQNNKIIKVVRERTGYTSQQIVGWCRQRGAENPGQLTPDVCNELVEAMALGWGKSKFDSAELCERSFRGKVETLQASGMSQESAIVAWIESLSQATSKV